MVKQEKRNIRSYKDNPETPSALKSFEPSEDELIRLLSNKRENQRAKQTWEWELTRRNSVKSPEIY